MSRYSFCTARNGALIPSIIDSSGGAHPLHSMYDPYREAERLISDLCDENGHLTSEFLVILGLGGGFIAEAALRRNGLAGICIIDYDANGMQELLHAINYDAILGDPRCHLLIDPGPREIEDFITGHYLPAVCGNIKILPLRTRTEQEQQRFTDAVDALRRSIAKVSSDYSVQAHFGTRWFSNIIRNLCAAENISTGQTRSNGFPAPAQIGGNYIHEAAICAAGPSLDIQIPRLAGLKKKDANLFIIATDTSAPALLNSGVRPDAIVSIDCQHISYYHFMGIDCRRIPLFLDIASPPLVAACTDTPVFCSCGHPFARYISRNWMPLPELDTSGGTVTYACLSLAGGLGAEKITVYGADFSYPHGKVYARGTYIFPFFEKKQNRLNPLEALVSDFLYRSPFLAPCGPVNYYETATLRQYRERTIKKANSLNADVFFEPGIGPDIQTSERSKKNDGDQYCGASSTPGDKRNGVLYAPQRPRTSAREFLTAYKRAVEKLAVPETADGTWLGNLAMPEKEILYTLLPLAAALKRHNPSLYTISLLEAAKQYCIEEILSFI